MMMPLPVLTAVGWRRHAVGLGCLLLCSGPTVVWASYDGVISDAHAHLRPGVSTELVMKQMDRSDVDISVIMGRAGVSDAEVLEFHRQYPQRIVPAIGFQNNRWRSKDAGFLGDVADKAASGDYQWLGEAGLRRQANGKLHMPPDHAMVAELFQIAARHKLPVTIHHNTFSSDERQAFLDLLARFPGVTVVWAHWCGLTDPKTVRTWLDAYPNLHCDLAWLYKDQEEFPVAVVDEDDHFLPEWKALIEAYPDRFLAGIDASKEGHYKKKYPNRVRKIRKALGGLDPAVARKVATENLHRLLSLAK